VKDLLHQLLAGHPLSAAQAQEAFAHIMSGQAEPCQTAALLTLLAAREPTTDELVGAATVMRQHVVPIAVPANLHDRLLDTCGTGGVGSRLFNVSTAAAIVAAACGVPVAKHGNRALSSKSGSADVLAALGVRTDADFSLVRESLWDNNIGFLMAPRHHSAMRHVGGVRVELGTRTLFNLLGPLSNPAGARRQLVGVFAGQWVEPMAEVLGRLGTERAWVVHGTDGLDELTVTGPTHVAEWRDGRLHRFQVTPEQAGLPLSQMADLKGGDAEHNATALLRLLDGEKGAYRNIVLLNAAAALVIAGQAGDLKDGAAQAARAIDGGTARRALVRLVEITNREPPAP